MSQELPHLVSKLRIMLIVISSSRIGVDMQRVEEVKVNMFIALPSDVDIGPSIPNSNCFENGTYYGVSILRK